MTLQPLHKIVEYLKQYPVLDRVRKLRETPYTKSQLFSQHNQLKQASFPPELIAFILGQWSSFKQLQEKVPRAQDWLVTPTSVQQASHHLISEQRIHLLHSLGLEHPGCLHEIGAGLGSDTLAWSDSMPVTVWEHEICRAHLLDFNLKQSTVLNPITVHAQSYEQAPSEIPENTWLYADPNRRNSSGRLQDPNDWTPSLEQLQDWSQAYTGTVLKLAPGFEPNPNLPGHYFYIGLQGKIKECLAIWHPRLNQISKQAIELSPEQSLKALASVQPPVSPISTTHITPPFYCYNPLPSVLRSDSLYQLATLLDAHLLSPGIAFLASSRHTPNPWSKAVLVHTVLPFKVKALQKHLAEHPASSITLMKRGVDLDPANWIKKLKTNKKGSPTVVIGTKIQGINKLLVGELS